MEKKISGWETIYAGGLKKVQAWFPSYHIGLPWWSLHIRIYETFPLLILSLWKTPKDILTRYFNTLGFILSKFLFFLISCWLRWVLSDQFCSTYCQSFDSHRKTFLCRAGYNPLNTRHQTKSYWHVYVFFLFFSFFFFCFFYFFEAICVTSKYTRTWHE